jgi:NhaP-type Na+/H+ or K+/H+ antiporter
MNRLSPRVLALLVCSQDAVGIVLFEVFEELDNTVDGDESWQIQVLAASGRFVVICVASTALGVVVGLAGAWLTKVWVAGEAVHFEVTMVFFICYLSYMLGELTGYLSGIFCLFSTALVSTHYTLHNISADAALTTNTGFKTVAWLSGERACHLSRTPLCIPSRCSERG